MSLSASPRISVIIPAFNRERFLADSIESILAQTYPASEIIVVDDGSTDRTAEVAQSFGDAVKYVFQENGGAAVARNTGVGIATGEWFAFLDSDDVWLPDLLARQIEQATDKNVVYFAKQRIESVADDKGLLNRIIGEDGLRWPATDADNFVIGAPTEIARGHYLQLNTMYCHRETFFDVGLFDPALRAGQDEDWFFRAALSHPIKLLPEVLAIRRLHENQTGLHKIQHVRSLTLVLGQMLERAERAREREAAAAARVRLANTLSRLSNACAASGDKSGAMANAWRAWATQPKRVARAFKVPLFALGWAPAQETR